MNLGKCVSFTTQRRATAFVGLALILTLFASSVGAQDPANRRCYECKGAGVLPCTNKACKPDKCGLKMPHDCSQIYSLTCCRGTQKVLCPKCKDPVAEAELNSELDRRKGWLDRMREFDTKVVPAAHVETIHWIMHDTIPTWRVGDQTLTRDRMAHLFIERIEIATVRFQQVTGVLPVNKQTAILVVSSQENMKATITQAGVGQKMPYKLLSHQGLFTTYPHEDFLKDENFHPHVIHNATHLLTHACITQPPDLCPWFHEAMSHWIEIDLFGRQTTFCSQEVKNKKDAWELSNWKKNIYEEVCGTKDEALAAIMTRDTDKLSSRDKAHGWSFLEFMIRTRPEEFKKFYAALKNTNDTKKAMQTGLGLSTAAFQEKWREYVRKTYAP